MWCRVRILGLLALTALNLGLQFSACALGSGLRGLTVVLLGRAGFELGGIGALRVRIVWLSVFWSRDLRGKGETASGSLKNPP